MAKNDHSYDILKLDNQVCFPLYACSKELVRQYTPYLKELNLTYTQYIAMMVLWEQERCSVKELGQKLYLDSGTLTPVLKSLEQKGFIRRFRSESDERVLLVELTKDGEKLKKSAEGIPQSVGACIGLSPEEAIQLYTLLYKVLGNVT